MIMWMKKANNFQKFQIVKVQPQGVAWFLLDFLPISSGGVAYKSDACKKSMCIRPR